MMKSFPRAIYALLWIFFVAGAFLFVEARRIVHSEADPQFAVENQSFPLKIAQVSPVLFPSTSPQNMRIREILKHPPRVELDGPIAAHLLILYPDAAITRSDVSSATDVELLMTGHDLKSVHHKISPIVRTWEGARFRMFRSTAFGENHRDVFLAAFAQAHLSLNAPLQVPGENNLKVADILDDSVANFTLDQREIEWTTIAYCLYLPSATEWHNKDNQSFTFDDLTGELLNRKLSQSSCGGSHLADAITFMLRRDEVYPRLSLLKKTQLRNRVRELVSRLISAQEPDGSWTLSWYGENPKTSSIDQRDEQFYRVLVTGHLLEWLTYVPSDLQPERRVYAKAAAWLIPQLEKISMMKNRDFFCPWTHGASALKSLCEINNADNLSN